MTLSRPITLHMPCRIEVGPSSTAKVGDWAGPVERSLIIASPHTTGYVGRLGLRGTLTVLADIPGEPEIATLDAALVTAREARPELVVGLGGGSVLDLAKLVAAMWDADQSLGDVAGPDRVAADFSAAADAARSASSPSTV